MPTATSSDKIDLSSENKTEELAKKLSKKTPKYFYVLNGGPRDTPCDRADFATPCNRAGFDTPCNRSWRRPLFC